jgi:uncharacterized protein YbjT (DUF2867 family)
VLMQNILGSWNKIRADGIFPALSAPNRKFALIDKEDLGEAIGNILIDKSLRNATFELACPDTLTLCSYKPSSDVSYPGTPG